MRTHRLLGIIGLFLAPSLVGLSVTLHLQAQSPTVQVAPEGEKMLAAFAEATNPGAPATALSTWATTYKATVSAIAKDKTTAKGALAFVSGDTTAQDPPPSVGQGTQSCTAHCPAGAYGKTRNKAGTVIDYACIKLDGCSYDSQLKKWRCTYTDCIFWRSATIVPQ